MRGQTSQPSNHRWITQGRTKSLRLIEKTSGFLEKAKNIPSSEACMLAELTVSVPSEELLARIIKLPLQKQEKGSTGKAEKRILQVPRSHWRSQWAGRVEQSPLKYVTRRTSLTTSKEDRHWEISKAGLYHWFIISIPIFHVNDWLYSQRYLNPFILPCTHRHTHTHTFRQDWESIHKQFGYVREIFHTDFKSQSSIFLDQS